MKKLTVGVIYQAQQTKFSYLPTNEPLADKMQEPGSQLSLPQGLRGDEETGRWRRRGSEAAKDNACATTRLT